ncbi:proton-coupled folate transporter-like [Sitophilus oryzae]|uniref:Proton-coupled folate transporter-like n=1 Tax=Sitophilus oryzae TaxID=7048 RepID=A0A6J2X9E1_SITOR|nr:proton-coupled folate transporter-like [Sitophilus oryzae]
MGFKLTIEVPLFLSTVGFMLTMSVNSNLLIYRTCYAYLHYNKTECAMLGMVSNNITEYLEKKVEPYSDYISLVKNIMDSVLGSILCLFIAPWSDKFGRKPILVIGLLGGVLSLGLHILFAALENLTPWFLLVLSLPVLITGGSATFMTVLSAYLTDSTTKEERGFRMGLFDVVMTSAVLIGNTASSYVLAATSYVMVYCIAAVCHIIALIFTTLFIAESLHERDTGSKILGFLNTSNVLEMFKTPFKARVNSNRKILLLIMLTLWLTEFAMGGASLGFLFLREKFHWTLKQFTWFISGTNILGIIGTLFVVYLLHTVLKIKESVLIVMGYMFSVASFILSGAAINDWEIYLAAVINLPASGMNALTRSLLSKMVKEDEIAKIFSVISISSSIIDPISSTGYTALYNATINTDAGLFNFVSAAIFSVGVVIFSIIVIIQRKSPTVEYTIVPEESEETHNDQVNSTIITDDITVIQ